MFQICHYKVFVVWLILQYLHFESNAAAEIPTRCRSWQFQCNNGQCINANSKCDTKIDCWDESDEKYENCFQLKCPEQRCSYGACFEDSKLCDGKKDCWDGTDEYIFHCANETQIDELYTTLIRGDCPDTPVTQFKCKQSKECIPYSAVCDGFKNCRDESDESTQHCVGSICLKDSFRCAYGACVAGSAACNNVIDCRDGSDELPAMCENWPNKTTKFVPQPVTHSDPTSVPDPAYVPTEVSSSADDSEKSCIVPTEDKAVRLTTMYNGLPYQVGNRISHQSTIRLACTSRHVLVGHDVNTCDNGKWKAPWPECVKVCAQSTITNDLSINAVCSYHGKVIDCATNPLKVNTIAEITCAQGYKKNTTELKGKRICAPDGKWKLYNATITRRNQCMPDCGKTFHTVEGNPWLVSIYYGVSMSNYNFLCLATIVDPMYVLTAASCLASISDFHNAIIVLGNHSVPFDPTKEHGFDIFEIHTLEIVKKVALLKMVNPFVLSAKVRPICLSRSPRTSTNSPLISGFFGEPFTSTDPDQNALVLTHVMDNEGWNKFDESQLIRSHIREQYIIMDKM